MSDTRSVYPIKHALARSASPDNPWFKRLNLCPRPRLRLFCFPYAGGSASVFRRWPAFFTEDIELIGVQYPGRAERYNETLIADCDQMVDAIYTHIPSLLDIPTVFFGHSNGGLIAYELARKLQSASGYALSHLFLSASRSAADRHVTTKRSALNDEALIRELVSLNGTPPALLEDQEMLALYLPILRADFAIADNYRYCATPCLKGNATVLYGLQDDSMSAADINGWQKIIDGTVDVIPIDGGHFFIHESLALVMSHVKHQLYGLPG
ncbi:thioesterase II family protein [Musicola paradisiaca]|uniref:Oleoyl-(Acyl-carrier-protein) hydrolase n=1 Tax=Musicola paradisiaca (strain Ech703) TaxID=579405 RepID=C6C4A2_MUSP7|nr:thioesterase domain-containing protein [Musicola paradisiaca]ACS85476.1 Oleoyl-(acyl-carrier-protein) hydrolase [Musicola paradisiaca Ech703]